ncbi:tetraspanin [Elysia marginata]|uniref:Tetraspanin n=1 Tax=Elysia marginata TaxID=1093978 RepID=A0AAV4H0I7_9GAST|nr:tetraspanin [Elysia marginata]
MADNISEINPNDDSNKEEHLVALTSDVNEIFAECADRQPLKLNESESGQFDNFINGSNVTTPPPQDHGNGKPHASSICRGSDQKTKADEIVTEPSDADHNEISALSGADGAGTQQLHADLNSIIYELQRIANDTPETNTTNDGFQETAKYLQPDSSFRAPEKDPADFLSSVMEDLSVMAENIEHDIDEATNKTDTNLSLSQEANKKRSDPTSNEDDTKTATAARKRYASTKSRKVENKEEDKSEDRGSTGESASLKDEKSHKDSKSKQSKLMQFLTGKRNKSKSETPQLKKTNSADFISGKQEADDPLRPLSMHKNSDYHKDIAQANPTFITNQCSNVDNIMLHKYKDTTTIEMNQRDPETSNECGSKVKGTRNRAFVESPHVAEVHMDKVGKSAAVGATSNTEEDDDEEANEVVLDMERLLSKLDLSDKIKRQIRQASQLSFQLQHKSTENQEQRDIMKRWRSLDTPTYHRTTSQPSPNTPNPLRTLRPWKIPMAIKMMKNLRKQQSSIEEDRLSLEFFVPGKKTTIRLHRWTFFNFLLKYSIFFFTFIFWIGSLSCISYGTWMLTHKSNIIDNVTDVFLDPYVLLCVVGAVVFIVAFIGCLGALRENIYLLKIFHTSLTFVVVLEVFVGTLVFLFYTMPEFRTAVKVGPEEVLKSAVKRYFDDEIMRDWIDTVQKEFGCCGVSMSNKGYLDWQENQYFNCSDSNPSMHRCSVPLSCCIFEEGDYINYMCGAGIMKEEPDHISHIINTKGCMKSFGEWLAKNDSVIGFAGLGLIGLQILGVISGRYFIKHLREGDPSGRKQSDRIQIGPAEETPAEA